jgi:hypothetical protein
MEQSVSPSSGGRPLGLLARIALVGLSLAALVPAALRAQEAPQRQGPRGEQVVNAYLAEKALQVTYLRNMDLGDLGTNGVRGGFFINEDRDLVAMADIVFNVGKTPTPRRLWSLQVGPRVYGALLNVENQDIFALGIGGTISYFIGGNRMTALSGTAYYAPDISTFGNADRVTDFSVQIETPLTPNTHVYAGYRWFRFDLAPAEGIDSGDREVDDGVHIGVSYRF